MNKIFFSSLLLSSALTVAAKETVTVNVTVDCGTITRELIIKPVGTDPMRGGFPTLSVFPYSTTITTDHISKYELLDIGEIKTKGMTSLFGEFLTEDGATVNLHVTGNQVIVTSDGPEFRKQATMDSVKEARFRAAYEAIKNFDDPVRAGEMKDSLMSEYQKWKLDYLASYPMISFLLDLEEELTSFRHESRHTLRKLKLYHDVYAGLYPGHPAHAAIAAGEAKGLQMTGGPYHPYFARTLQGEKVNSESMLGKGGHTLVICWATWCPSCRREAIETIDMVKTYTDRGLTVFALAREFGSTDNLKAAIEADKYPWPTLVDLDDEFGVFDKHGASSSAMFLIGPDSTILDTPFSPDDLKEALARLMP